LLVVDGDGMPHLPLTCFYAEMQEGFSDGTARTYLNVLLPYFTYITTDSWRQHRQDHWDSEPEAVHASVRDYLLHKLRCKVRRQGFHEVVMLTVDSPSTIRVFLAALKHFYHVARGANWYPYAHPLIDPVAHVVQEIDREERADGKHRPRMPQVSGVEAPQLRHPSENYFRLVEQEWVPHPIDDPHLHLHLLRGFERAHLCLRDRIVVRIAYESGARIREILRLTVGDWRARGCNQEATTFSKGSRGRRVKFLRFSPETAKMLRQYLNTERQAYDPQHRRLEHLSDTDPLFLSTRGVAYDYEAFKPHWYALCKVVGLDLNIHGLRHWYTTQAMRTLCETATTPGELERGKEALIRYMAWRDPATLDAYEHHFQARQHATLQDQLHIRLAAQDAAYISQHQDVPPQASPSLPPAANKQGMGDSTENGWGRLLALGGGALHE
jgi:integrase